MAAPGANPLRTFRDHVEDHVAHGTQPALPKGYLGMVELETTDPAYDVVIVGNRSYVGELLGVRFDALMAGTQLRWYFRMAEAKGLAHEHGGPRMVKGARADGWHGTAPQD